MTENTQDNKRLLALNDSLSGTLPEHLGIEITHSGPLEIHARMEIKSKLLAPNGYLHAGSVVTLADTAAGIGCAANLPQGAESFTTVELKSNHLGTCRTGAVSCIARAIHAGRSTQLWDATVVDENTGKTIALFRCTQMILYPKVNRVGGETE